MKKLIIFDLDDTLYNEAEYVLSGFNVAAEYLGNKYSLSNKDIYDDLIEIFNKKGRGQVFDLVLEKYDIDKGEVENLVKLYREHDLDIGLLPGAEELLIRLKQGNVKLILMTDTRWQVQERKVKALNVEKYFDKIFYTDKYNTNKSDVELLSKLLDIYKLEPNESALVGDDPDHDFIGAKQIGIKTYRIKQLRLKNVTSTKTYEADIVVNSIQELQKLLIR